MGFTSGGDDGIPSTRNSLLPGRPPLTEMFIWLNWKSTLPVTPGAVNTRE